MTIADYSSQQGHTPPHPHMHTHTYKQTHTHARTRAGADRYYHRIGSKPLDGNTKKSLFIQQSIKHTH